MLLSNLLDNKLDALIKNQTNILAKLSATISETKYNDEIQVHYDKAVALPIHLSLKIEFANNHILTDNMFVGRFSGTFYGSLKMIESFICNDTMIRAILPRYLTIWETIWSAPKSFMKQTFIRKVQVKDFLPFIVVNVYVMFIRVNNDTKSDHWRVCILSQSEFEQYRKLILIVEAPKRTSLFERIVAASVPLSQLTIKQEDNNVIRYEFTILAGLHCIPFMLYKKIIVRSATDSLLRLAQFCSTNK
jgi:hypothetical protein